MCPTDTMQVSTMGTRLRDMISSIRACKTAAEERGVVAKECAVLRDAFKDGNQYYRHRNVAKLMFIHMLGYPTHFGQMECIKLIAANDFPEKRIGYLGLMLLLDERQEVLMLVTNSVKNDLHHANQYVTGLALCALGNICTAEMARDLSLEVEKLLQNNNSYLRKKCESEEYLADLQIEGVQLRYENLLVVTIEGKAGIDVTVQWRSCENAALCAVRIVRKVPDLIESFMGPASNLLMDKHHGVLVAGVKLCMELCQTTDVALEHFRKQVSTIVRVLKNLVLSGYAPEYDVAGITDPLLQIKLLRFLRILGKGDTESSDIMSDVLAQVATNTESAKNAGNAILYECVQTIMAIEDIGGLRVLAVNILGRFLANRDNNIRYVALNILVRVVTVDTQAVQRHRNTIVECIKDSDVSIRRRALELVFNLVSESNVKALTKELLEYLKVSDPEFKVDLTSKIAALVQKFSPSKQWYIDQMVSLMVEAGEFVNEEVTGALVVVISNATELQGYTVRLLYRSIQNWHGQESLAHVTLWCFGEYGDMLVNHLNELEGEDPQTVTESDAVDVVESILRDSRVTPNTVAFSLTALLKLSSRFPQCTERIQSLIEAHKGSLILELQQRSIEFASILARHSNISALLLERMPVLEESSYAAKHAEVEMYSSHGKHKPSDHPHAAGSPAAPGSHPASTNHLMDLLSFQDEDVTPPSKSAGDALLDLLGDGPTTTSNGGTTSVPNPIGSPSPLLDILSLGEPAESTPGPGKTLSATTLEATRSSTTGKPISLVDTESATAPQPRSSLLDDDSVGFFFGTPSMPGQPEPVMYPSIVAMETKGLKVTFDFTKPSSSPQTTVIRATYTNTSTKPYTDFIFQAAVPKFMSLRLDPASSASLPASSSGVITQLITLTNSLHGQKPLIMKLRISYTVDGQAVLEQGQVNNFPANL